MSTAASWQQESRWKCGGINQRITAAGQLVSEPNCSGSNGSPGWLAGPKTPTHPPCVVTIVGSGGLLGAVSAGGGACVHTQPVVHLLLATISFPFPDLLPLISPATQLFPAVMLFLTAVDSCSF
jgi:hypothetical protein